jgi:AAA+ ATPase superfamily predicted ATPase
VDWEAALRLLAQVLPDDQASIVVLDEVPYLIDDDPTFEATLQKMWDRVLSTKPVLLVLIGSDLSMMEALSSHGRPFFQRGIEMVVPPLSPVETMTFVGAKDASAGLDAYLVTGGLPLLCDEWRRGTSLTTFLTSQLRSTTSPLIVSAERALAAEFPSDVQARDVLSVIGNGERTFTKIQTRLGIAEGSLTRSLDLLVAKRVVAKELPLSKLASKESRYRVADSYLRFWLYFIGPYMDEIERGRGDVVMKRITTNFSAWRGKSIEPVVREAMMRLEPISEVHAPMVGGYWTRTNDVEIDIVGADRVPATKLTLIGSIKWRDSQPFGGGDLAELLSSAARIPGYENGVPTVGVSRTGFSASPDIALGPEEIMGAWNPR